MDGGGGIREHWWYYVEEDASLSLPSKPNSLSTVIITTPVLGGGARGELVRAINRVLGERQKWAPFSCADRDRLEEAYHSGEEHRQMAVSGHSGQRLWLANLELMQMSALYWKGGSRVALRRSLWTIMPFEDDRYGGIPCPPEWERVLEERFQANLGWTSGLGETLEVVPSELLVDLDGSCLEVYQLCLLRGVPTMATLVPQRFVARGSIMQGFIPASPPKPIRLIRGYPSYHGAVISALNNPAATGQVPPPSLGPDAKAPKVPPSPFEEPAKEGGPVQHLVLVVHGIGQKLADKVGYGFVSAVNSLRRLALQAAVDNGCGLEDLYVLPIQWRVELEMGSGYFPEEQHSGDATAEFDSLMAAITLPSVPGIRTLATDVTVDVLLYMTPRHFGRIIEACVKEIRRIHALFRRWNPAASPRISLVGHSLGAALVYDILECLVDDDNLGDVTVGAVMAAAEKVKARLGFEVENFFSFGSPLSFFLLLKHLKPVACTGIQPSMLQAAIDTAIASLQSMKGDQAPPRMAFFACHRYYNLFMPHDPVAYRVEPLVIPPKFLDALLPTPALVPYHKGGMTGFKLEMAERVARTRIELTETITRSIPAWLKFRISAASTEALRIDDGSEADENTAPSVDSASPSTTAIPYPMNLIHHFNDHGRIDYVLQDALLESAYLAAISSHFSYWSDEDVAIFLVKQLFNKGD